MFDTFSQSLFDKLPELEGLSVQESRRMLSRAYLAIIQLRVAESVEDLETPIQYLRRLADAMEYFAIFNENIEPDVKRACAFIAAESLALTADYYSHFDEVPEIAIRIRRNDVFTRVEAAILYLISQYDACAAGILADCPDPVEGQLSCGELSAEWCFEIIRVLCEFRLNPLPLLRCPIAFSAAQDIGGHDLEDDTVGRLYAKLGEAASAFVHWLGGALEDGLENADENLSKLIDVLKSRGEAAQIAAGIGDDFARIHHLAVLLKHLFSSLKDRSLVHVLPPPPDFDPNTYFLYLKTRATGEDEGSSGRPVLWPSAYEYVKNCIQGDVYHAVVSMPTGSGKSFVAELAISRNISSGWCLYLAPTNALTEQIRADLRSALSLLGTDVVAFIGDQEYSTLSTDVVSEVPPNTVVVMTPEKCFLALRLQPEVFKTCCLVVFDECQLIGELSSGRGVTAELVISQILLRAESCRFLLMSAIVQNPEDLAGWLKEATGNLSTPLTKPWRPTRTLRTALGVDYKSMIEGRDKIKQALKKLPDRRKKLRFSARYSLIGGLQGAWQQTNEEDYAIVTLPYDAELVVLRSGKPGNWKYKVDADSWVNGSARRIATFLAEQDIQTLVFIPTSKHYPFSVANKLSLSEECKATIPQLPDIVEICRSLAEYEFGMESQMFHHLDEGIAVHTSHMIETEKIASEIAFRCRAARIMLATGTLAQGLNLPAMAVVIAGTRIGDPRGEDAVIVEQRKLSQLLNAAGRAGRAGFANQGLVIAIPDKPLYLKSPSDAQTFREKLEYLQKTDNAVTISSGLDSFLDRITEGVLSTESAEDVELQTIAVLSGGDEKQPNAQEVLKKSFAAYLRRKRNLEDVSDVASQRLEEIRAKFIIDAKVPDWLPIAAQRAGLDFFITLSLLRAWERVQPNIAQDILTWSIPQWIDFLLQVLAHVPPGILLRQCPIETLKRGAPKVEDILRGSPKLIDEKANKWILPDEWLNNWVEVKKLLIPWINGDSLKNLASLTTGKSVDEIPPSRTAGAQPIPKVIALINDFFSVLSILAGGLVAIAEQLFKQVAEEGKESFSQGIPLSLACLPMCIKYGCDSPQTLAWFRFGVRLRRPAHLLAKAFPPPDHLQSDEQLRDWVREQRRQWLKGECEPDLEDFYELSAVFGAIYSFITYRGER